MGVGTTQFCFIRWSWSACLPATVFFYQSWAILRYPIRRQVFYQCSPLSAAFTSIGERLCGKRLEPRLSRQQSTDGEAIASNAYSCATLRNGVGDANKTCAR